MPLFLLRAYAQRAHRTGWYATRQYLLKRGYSLSAVTSLLIHILLFQGASNV